MSLRRSGGRAARCLVAVALVAAISLVSAGPSGAGAALTRVNRVSGNAFGLRAQGTLPLGVGLNIPPQPKASLNETSRTDSNQSATDSDTLGGISIPAVLTVGLLNVVSTGTTGNGGSSVSTADVANLSGLVNADAIHVECRADASGFTGGTTTTNLNILGAPVFPGTFSPPANTPVTNLLGVTITLNEVVNNSASREQSARRTVSTGHVNGIHIESNGPLGVFDIVVGHAHCSTTNRLPVSP